MRLSTSFLVALIAFPVLFAGCAAEYATPGARADFSALGLTPQTVAALTDSSVQTTLAKKPLVTFPADIAVVRVQAADYNSYSYDRYRTPSPMGRYSVMTKTEVETDADFDALSKLPRVEGVAMIRRILLDKTLNTDLELRDAAAKLNANLLLYYTLDTQFDNKTHVAPLGLITLGIAPTEEARVTCTASAVLMDTRNGYIYAIAEGNAANNQLANAWTSADAMDQARLKTERQAFQGMLDDFQKAWPKVLKTYDKTAITAQ